MRKLVLGILALISIQFAFVTYMMVLQSPMELTSASEPARAITPETILPRIEHFTNSIEPAEQPEIAVSPNVQRQARAITSDAAPERVVKQDRSPVRRTSKPAFDPVLSQAAAPVQFESVVISYDRNPKTSDCGAPEPPKVKKRSYLAKASPVIKKPWDWIKAVASKF